MRQIIAIGGGGFSENTENLAMENYILSSSYIDKPKVCFVSTASGDSEEYIERFYSAFSKLNCEPSHLALFANPPANLEEIIFEKNIFYIGGGSTRNLLILWQEWSLEKLLYAAYRRGAILSGISAGGMCWFEQGL